MNESKKLYFIPSRDKVEKEGSLDSQMVHSKSDTKINSLLKALIALGVWVIVLQNAGVIPTSQLVKVTNGVHVSSGSVDVANTVDVAGAVNVNGPVAVDGLVDVNIDRINGYSWFYDGQDHLGQYCRIPVYTGF